jgi:hypothetical protein
MKALLLAVLAASLLATEAKAPEPPQEVQGAYWRVMAAYNGLALQYEQSLTPHQRDLQAKMLEYGQKIQPAMEALNAACATLKAGPVDQKSLNEQGIIRCGPPPLDKPKTESSKD